MTQLIIFLTGIIAIWLTQQDRQPDWKRFACVVGLAGQPFWLVSTFQAAQWGIFALSIAYSCVWLLGIWNNWLKAGSRYGG